MGSQYYENEVEMTETDSFRREIFSDSGAEIRIEVEVEDIPDEHKKRLVDQLNLFVQNAHDLLVEIGGDLL
jgi:hypothetical protein